MIHTKPEAYDLMLMGERCPTCQRFLPVSPAAQDILRTRLGENIRRARIAAGMTQEEVAINFDPPMARATLTRIEGGQAAIDFDRLVILASIIGVELRELLTGL